MKSHKLLIIALVMMIAGLILSVLTLIYIISNQEKIALRLDTFQNNISKLNPIKGKDATDEQIRKAVEDYCRENCRGPQGQLGVTGAKGQMGLQGNTGLQGERGAEGPQGPVGPQGPQGIQGNPGPQGEPGVNGRDTERRCVVVNPTTRRIEWRNAGDDSWQIEYYLSEGQLCPQEIE